MAETKNENETEKLKEDSSPIKYSDPDKENDDAVDLDGDLEERYVDPDIVAQNEMIKNRIATTDLEISMKAALERKETHIVRLRAEVTKLRNFLSKRKQSKSARVYPCRPHLCTCASHTCISRSLQT